MDSIIAVATKETADDVASWADAVWHGRRPDFSAFERRLVLAMTAAAMAGLSTFEVEELVTDPGDLERHASTDEVFRDMVRAIAKRKPTLASLNPKELDEKLRQRVFFVTGVAKGNILDRIQQRLVEARVKGHGLGWFQAQVSQLADLSLPHIETVFRTNVEAAAGAARWKGYHDPETEDLFYGFRYWNPRDEKSRPLHRLMHGFCALKEDPIWRIIWTPNGFRCRCKVRGLRLHQAIDVGLLDDAGKVKAPRVYRDDAQRALIQSIESGTAVVVGRRRLRFPDEGFSGNALMDLV